MMINPSNVEEITYNTRSLTLKATSEEVKEQRWVSICVEFSSFTAIDLFVRALSLGWGKRVPVSE